MPEYKALRDFIDLEDKDKVRYKKGDQFPDDGRKTITKKRLDSLISKDNRLKEAVIEKVKEDKPKKETKKSKNKVKDNKDDRGTDSKTD